MNTQNITVEDCEEMYTKKSMYTVIHNGQIEGFKAKNEKSPATDR